MGTETLIDYITSTIGMENSIGTLFSPLPCDTHLLSKHNMVTETY